MYFTAVINSLIPIIMLLGVGAAAHKLRWLNRNSEDQMLRLIINVFIPCLIFASITDEATDTSAGLIAELFAWGFAMPLVGIMISLAVGWFVFRDQPSTRHTFATCSGMHNYAYIPLYLIGSLFGQQVVGLVFIFTSGVELCLWSVGVTVLSGKFDRNCWKKIINPPLISLIVALLIKNAFDANPVPVPVQKFFSSAGAVAIPLGLLISGSTLAERLQHVRFTDRSLLKTAVAGSIIRLAVMPLLVLTVASFAAGHVQTREILIVQAAMPAAMFTLVLSRHYKGEPVTALVIIATTTLLGFATIPAWVALGQKWLL
ncbi:auxin efflux carrier [Anaerohalosphaera lusitana]|uniref:Auxin efflux carrier n=2 Tax=Anaerohalosphaera lusitana TaxID=1936003 RepID=A0A1U9NI83_9BACT|nr:auxin efflux carrier [Anaerohalosphaera lusitana]